MIRPLHNRILIRRHDPEADSFGGIHIPEEHRDRPLKATVVAVATRTSHSGATLPAMVAVGDVVLVGKFAGIEVRDPETHELLAMVDESEVVGIFESEPVLQALSDEYRQELDFERLMDIEMVPAMVNAIIKARDTWMSTFKTMPNRVALSCSSARAAWRSGDTSRHYSDVECDAAIDAGRCQIYGLLVVRLLETDHGPFVFWHESELEGAPALTNQVPLAVGNYTYLTQPVEDDGA